MSAAPFPHAPRMDARAQRKARRDLVAQRSAEREAQGRNKKHRSAFRKLRRRLGAALIETLAPWILRALARTWRLQRSGDEGFAKFTGKDPWICATWHGRMLTLMPIREHCRRGISVLVSPSEDGGLAKRALDKFGYTIVRGSLSKRGARAMREMHEVISRSGQLAITPDGPRGPRHSINTGPAWLARATGAPLLGVAVAADRAWRLKSWDRMTIPKPFAKLHIHYLAPVTIGADCSDEELEALSATLREQLIAAERDAFKRLGAPSDLEEHAAAAE